MGKGENCLVDELAHLGVPSANSSRILESSLFFSLLQEVPKLYASMYLGSYIYLAKLPRALLNSPMFLQSVYFSDLGC